MYVTWVMGVIFDIWVYVGYMGHICQVGHMCCLGHLGHMGHLWLSMVNCSICGYSPRGVEIWVIPWRAVRRPCHPIPSQVTDIASDVLKVLASMTIDTAVENIFTHALCYIL